MRQERITYIGAYNHVTNRGYDGNYILLETKTKTISWFTFDDDAAKKMKIRLFAYCNMDKPLPPAIRKLKWKDVRFYLNTFI